MRLLAAVLLTVGPVMRVGAGGIEVTETLDLKPSTPRWVRQKKILDNDSYIDEGVELALHPWIPSKRLSR